MSLRNYPIREYFIAELMSTARHEYFDGEIFVIGGESIDHATICSNLVVLFHDSLRGGSCQAFSSGMRIRTPSGLYTYPDASIVCGLADVTRFEDTETIGNPVVLVEVLSDSTRDYDRGLKFDLYRSITSLRDYLLVEQSRMEIEHRCLTNGEWLSRTVTEGTLRLTGVELDLPLSLVYERVTF